MLRDDNLEHKKLQVTKDNLEHIFSVPDRVRKCTDFIDEGEAICVSVIRLLEVMNAVIGINESSNQLLFSMRDKCWRDSRGSQWLMLLNSQPLRYLLVRYGPAGKFLFAHKHLMDLENSRDELLYELHRQPQQSKTNLFTIQEYFKNVRPLNAKLEKKVRLALA